MFRVIAMACLMLVPVTSGAQTAIVIGPDAAGGSAPQGASLASRVLAEAGYDVIPLRSLPEAVSRLTGLEAGALVYYGGTGSRLQLSADIDARNRELAAFLSQAETAGQMALLADICPAPEALAAPHPGLLIALPAAPGTACPDDGFLAKALAEAARRPPQPLGAALRQAGAWVAPGSPTGPDFGTAAPAAPAPQVGVVRNETMVLTRPVRPVATEPTRIAAVTPAVSTQGSETAIAASPILFSAEPSPERMSRPVPDGYPEPSIIVGYITEPEPEDPLAGLSIVWNDLDARRALRAEDPELFQLALSRGLLDPPSEETAAAIQSELARMRCYTSAVDGIWGNGSRGAVARYVEQAGVQIAAAEPTTELFRQILLTDDVTCPAPAPVEPRRTTQQTAPRAPAPTPPAQQPAPQPQPERRTIDPSAGGIGVFR